MSEFIMYSVHSNQLILVSFSEHESYITFTTRNLRYTTTMSFGMRILLESTDLVQLGYL